MVGKRSWMRDRLWLPVSLFAMVMLSSGCVRLVSPYSADLQKRASDMTAEVTAWDKTMSGATGTIAVKDVQATLAKWNGEVAAMAGIAASIDPGVVRCDWLAGKMTAGVVALLPKDLRDQVPAPRQSKADAPPQGCEATMFGTMADDITEITGYLVSQCGMTALQDAGAKGAPATVVMTSNCRALFGGGSAGQNGPAVNNLLRALNAVVYVEGRKQPATPAK